MIIYLVVFLISLFFIYLSEVFKNHKFLRNLFVIISILIISIFAGIRGETIGTDVLVYIKPYFHYIETYGLSWLYSNSKCEILYLIMNDIIIKLGGNLQVLLFTITFAISLIYYRFAKSFDKEINVLMSYSVYLFVFFGITLNLARQSIAMVIVLYAMKYLKNKDFKKYLICFIIAFGFHRTSVLFFPLYFLYLFFGTNKEKIIKYIIGFASCLVIILSSNIVKFLGYIFEKYNETYINRYMINNWQFNFSWEAVKIVIFLILMFLLHYNNKSDNNKIDKNYFNFCKFLLVLDIIFFQIGAKILYAERFSYYFMIISYSYLIPCLLNVFDSKKTVKSIGISSILIFFILVLYFIIVYGVLKISSIVPYLKG